MIRILYVWQLPVRLTHWINAICVVVLSVTGIYIGHPFISAGATADFLMGWTRFIHYSFAYLFTFSVLARVIWFVIGNEWASWRMFFPWKSRKGRKNALDFFRYYTFTGSRIPYEVGHNALASMAYAAIFTLFIVQIVSGFALYGQYAPGGFWDSILGPVVTLVGNQTLRLTHHLVMWLLAGFVINHIYSAWLMDMKEMNGTMSSIFGGYKYIDQEEL